MKKYKLLKNIFLILIFDYNQYLIIQMSFELTTTKTLEEAQLSTSSMGGGQLFKAI